jgi:hypothetical protein
MTRAVEAGHIDQAAALAESAARHVPESAELTFVAHLHRGLALIASDQSAKAAVELRAAKAFPGPQGAFLDQLLLKAEMAAAFEAKNYDEFLQKSTVALAHSPGDKMAVAAVASAHACKYAVSGLEEDRKQAVKRLDEAAKLGGPSAAFDEYRGLIQHRLDTREVVSRQEFRRRFPSGYQPGRKP